MRRSRIYGRRLRNILRSDVESAVRVRGQMRRAGYGHEDNRGSLHVASQPLFVIDALSILCIRSVLSVNDYFPDCVTVTFGGLSRVKTATVF